ncbi:MAG: hypothetical protein WDN50_10820 [Bradyrhizobium sp.]
MLGRLVPRRLAAAQVGLFGILWIENADNNPRMDLSGCGNNKSRVGKVSNKRDPVWFPFSSRERMRKTSSSDTKFVLLHNHNDIDAMKGNKLGPDSSI